MDIRTVEQAVREFAEDAHLVQILQDSDDGWLPTFNGETGEQLPGIRGRAGAFGLSVHGEEIGADLIEMQPGSEFPLHVHPGDHILFGISGRGKVHINGADYPIDPGTTVFIAADYPHGVRTYSADEFAPSEDPTFRLLAVGVPHERVDSLHRMTTVGEEERAELEARVARGETAGGSSVAARSD